MSKYSRISTVEELDRAIVSVRKELNVSRKRLASRRKSFGDSFSPISLLSVLSGRIPELLSGAALMVSLLGKIKGRKKRV